MSFNPNASYGRAILDMVKSQVPTFGRVFVVKSSSDSADPNYDAIDEIFKPDSEGVDRVFTSLKSAYDAVTSNNNDVILLDAHTTHSLSAGLAVTKNRVHFIGMDGGDHLVQQGAKIEVTGATDTAYTLKDTGVRNTYRNIKFIQSSTHANALTVAQFGGEGTVVKNCSFVFGVADNLDGATTYEVVAGSDSATFLNCLFGTETLLTSAARTVFLIDQVTASQEFKSNIIKDCIFMVSSSSADASLLKVAANTDVLFTNLFDGCKFMASVDSAGGIALTNAATSAASLVKGTINFYLPGVFNCTNFSASDSTAFKVAAPAASNNAFESVTPA